jgi:aryl sulfotransferase
MGELRRYRTMLSDSARWDGFPFREGDVVISPPAKCGTTWMQMLCALLVFDTADLPHPLTELSPWVDAVTHDIEATRATLADQRHRRFVKTHTPLDGLPFDERVSYICVGRDPRDVALSYAHSMANLEPTTFRAVAQASGRDTEQLGPPPRDAVERFWRWVEGERNDDQRGGGATLARMVHHVETFWQRRDEPQVVLFHYADLQTDLPGQLRRLAAVLDIELGHDRAEQLSAEATFDRMRSRADELAPGVDTRLWRDNRAFFHSGTSGQWRDLLDAEAVARYQDRLAELAPPDLATWLHTGWLDSEATSAASR